MDISGSEDPMHLVGKLLQLRRSLLLHVNEREIKGTHGGVIADVLKNEAIPYFAKQPLGLREVSKPRCNLPFEPRLAKVRPQVRELAVKPCILVKDFRRGAIVS